MTALEDHPQGHQCVNGLYATFDPNFTGISFMTVPFSEDDDVAVWAFTADWMGSEEEEGIIVATGLVSVAKETDLIAIYTWFPIQSFSLVSISPEGAEEE